MTSAKNASAREIIGRLNAAAVEALADLAVRSRFVEKQTGTKFTLVPYRGVPPRIAGLPLVRAGSIKVYAVTSDTRFPQAPDIPTFAEMGVPAVFLSLECPAPLAGPRTIPGASDRAKAGLPPWLGGAVLGIASRTACGPSCGRFRVRFSGVAVQASLARSSDISAGQRHA
jgi:hypothetical protein